MGKKTASLGCHLTDSYAMWLGNMVIIGSIRKVFTERGAKRFSLVT